MEDFWGHRGRLRAQYIQTGGKSFAAHNLLELLLFYAIPRRDTKNIAHALLKRFGDVSGVFNATVEELCQVKGISENSAVLIKLTAELGKRYCDNDMVDSVRFYTYDDIGGFLQDQYINVTKERVIALYLDNVGRLIKLGMVCDGGVNSARFDVRKIVADAIAADAGAVVVAHNHPSGSHIPSSDDLDATKMMKKVIESAGIEFVEHYVVGSDGTCRLLEKCAEQGNVELRQYFKFDV